MSDHLQNLSSLHFGQVASLKSIAQTHPMRKRLFELGFVPGAKIQLLRAAPFGDPIELFVSGTHFALRRSQLEQIMVEVES